MIVGEATMTTITTDDPDPIAQAQDLPSVRVANLPIILQGRLSEAEGSRKFSLKSMLEDACD
jgi:hypothetical protein